MFGKFSKLARLFDDELPSVPLETQLEKLAALGIRLNDGVSEDALLQRFTRAELEKNPYSMLLTAMGGVYDPAAPGKQTQAGGTEPAGSADSGAGSANSSADSADGSFENAPEAEPGHAGGPNAPGMEPLDGTAAADESGGEPGKSSSAFADELREMRRLRKMSAPSSEGEPPAGNHVFPAGSNAAPPDETDAAQFRPVSDDILYLDSDCIEEAGIYSEILRRLNAMTRGAADFRDISDTLDAEAYTATVSFSLGGQNVSFDLDVQDSTIDTAFFNNLNAALEANGIENRFYLHLAEPEILVIFSDRPTVKQLNGLTGVYFEAY